MTKTLGFVITAAVFLIAGAQNATGAPIFPPLVQGEYGFKIHAAAVELDAEGVPLSTPTAAVMIRRAGEATDLTACLPCGPDETVPVLVTIVAAGDRAELRGYAFASADCSGTPSESVNAAFVFFTPPAGPSLEP